MHELHVPNVKHIVDENQLTDKNKCIEQISFKPRNFGDEKVLKEIESPTVCCRSRMMHVLRIITHQISIEDSTVSAVILSTENDVILAMSQRDHEVGPYLTIWSSFLQPGAYITC